MNDRMKLYAAIAMHLSYTTTKYTVLIMYVGLFGHSAVVFHVFTFFHVFLCFTDCLCGCVFSVTFY